MAVQFHRKHVPFSAISLSLGDVAKIFERLQRCVKEHAETAVTTWTKPINTSEQEFAQLKSKFINEASRVTVTIEGRDGSTLFGDSSDLFESRNIPEHVSQIYMTNITAFQSAVGNRPTNAFEVKFDFSKPPLLDSNNPVSSPTENQSGIAIEGDRDSWTAAVHNAVFGILDHRGNSRRPLHLPFAYDVGVMIFGVPIAFYACWKVSPIVGAIASDVHPVLSGAVYVYLMLAVLWLYRVLFGYARWAFPVAEMTDNHSAATKHRAVLAALVLALASNLVWEVLKSVQS